MEAIVTILEEILDCLRRPVPVSPWLSTTQADRYVHRRLGTVSGLCKAGHIKSRKIGRARYVHTDWLDEWMESQEDGCEPQFRGLREVS
jgi:hypothetical protein